MHQYDPETLPALIRDSILPKVNDPIFEAQVISEQEFMEVFEDQLSDEDIDALTVFALRISDQWKTLMIDTDAFMKALSELKKGNQESSTSEIKDHSTSKD